MKSLNPFGIQLPNSSVKHRFHNLADFSDYCCRVNLEFACLVIHEVPFICSSSFSSYLLEIGIARLLLKMANYTHGVKVIMEGLVSLFPIAQFLNQTQLDSNSTIEF